MTIKFEIPSDNKALALAVGQALLNYAGGEVPATTVEPTVKDQGHFDPEEAPATTAEAQDAYVKAATETVAKTTIAEDSGNESHAAATDSGSAGGALSGAETDEKGVRFNPEFCGQAMKPFYGSGKAKGQWKKKVGVDQDAYEEWYAGELMGANIEGPDLTEDEPAEFNASAAFGKKAEPEKVSMSDGGSLMTWVSEQQAAGNLQQSDIDAAYKETGVALNDLFGPHQAEAAQLMYDALAAKV